MQSGLAEISHIEPNKTKIIHFLLPNTSVNLEKLLCIPKYEPSEKLLG